MTTFAVNLETFDLTASWDTRYGHACEVAYTFPPSTHPPTAFSLARTLTDLSTTLWGFYVDGVRPPTVGALLVQLDPPDQDSSDEPLNDILRPLGSLAANTNDLGVVDCVRREVAAEHGAVFAATRGLFEGRGGQALTLSSSFVRGRHERAVRSLLRKQPSRPVEDFAQFDPTSAAAALLHAMWGAFFLVRDMCDLTPLEVLQRADRGEDVPIDRVLDLVELDVPGADAADVTTALVQHARAVAAGRVGPVDMLLDRVDLMEATLGVDVAEETRLCLLDPSRPALDLIDLTTAGLRACTAAGSGSAQARLFKARLAHVAS